jgi:hypothetical protein
MDNFNSNDDFSFSNIKSVINYVIINYEKFILLLLVGIIIYFVDYITHINAFLYGAQHPIPGLTSLATPTPKDNMNNMNIPKIPKRKRLSRKNTRK